LPICCLVTAISSGSTIPAFRFPVTLYSKLLVAVFSVLSVPCQVLNMKWKQSMRYVLSRVYLVGRRKWLMPKVVIFEILTAVAVKIPVSWDVMSRTRYRCFGGICCSQLHGWIQLYDITPKNSNLQYQDLVCLTFIFRV
jgi:hypothetical protein